MNLLNLHTALPAEAAPLIQRFGLEPLPGQPGKRPRIYEGQLSLSLGEPLALRLAVGGMGRLAAAAAAGLLQGLALADAKAEQAAEHGERRSIYWLNLGIAGHGWRSLGEAVLATAVHEQASGTRLGLGKPFEEPCPLVEVETHDAVVHAYPESDRAVDMEAAAFVAAAKGYAALWSAGPEATRAAAAQVQCLKVISDNGASPLSRDKRLGPDAVSAFVQAGLPTLETLLERWLGEWGAHRGEERRP